MAVILNSETCRESAAAQGAQTMSSRLVPILIVSALLLAGVGDSFGRTLVENPAWRQLGVEAWAAFSRLADLGNGEIIYSMEGVGGTLLIVAAAMGFRLSPTRPLSVALPLYAAVVMRIGVLSATAGAAPIMLSIKGLGTDPIALQRAFDGFAHWGDLRAVFIALGYCAELWALWAVLRVRYRQPINKMTG
jgi:hypothetical protein